jgi:hypothetical protein
MRTHLVLSTITTFAIACNDDAFGQRDGASARLDAGAVIIATGASSTPTDGALVEDATVDATTALNGSAVDAGAGVCF